MDEEDRDKVSRLTAEHWGSEIVMVHGVVYKPAALPGFIAVESGTEEWLGWITYQVQGEDCEIVSLNSLLPARGIGSGLVEAVKDIALKAGCRRLWLITTNDNLEALRFYQKRGFVLVAVHRNTVLESRKMKPEIPLVGKDGIPIRDEIELEMPLGEEVLG